MRTPSSVLTGVWLGAFVLGSGVMVSALVAARAQRPAGGQRLLAADLAADSPLAIGGGGHPGFRRAPFAGATLLDAVGGPSNMAAAPAPLPVPPAPPPGAIPPLSALRSGPFVNFDSPMVRPLALTPDGATLLAADTPDNSMMVYDTAHAASGRLHLAARVPVGLEPVAVAVQPGPGGPADTEVRFAWVANFMSDDVSVIDLHTSRVVAVIPVGDEPVNIVFDETGSTAFVLTQGPTDLDPDFAGKTENRGYVLAVDTGLRKVVGMRRLDCNTPRGLAYDADLRRLYVSALHSGNDTTVVGRRVRLFHGPTSEWVHTIQMAQEFSLTSAIFNASAELSPWPDPGVVPDSPETHRIVTNTSQGAWAQVVDVLTLTDGTLDPGVVATFATEFNCTNAAVVLQTMVDDAAQRVDHDVIVLDAADVSGLSVIHTLGNVGTTITALAKHPVRPRVLVADLHPRNLERHEGTLNGRFIEHRLALVDLNPLTLPTAAGAAAVFDLHAGVDNFDDVSAPNPAAQAASLSNPIDIVYDPSGTRAYVASLAADRVAVVHPGTGQVLARVDVGRGPRGLALDGDAQRLYCLNRTDMTISILSVADSQLEELGRVGVFNPEPFDVREGRNFLYSAKTTHNFASSCALCHIDGNHDHLAWDLGDPHAVNPLPVPTSLTGITTNHPVKGPMVTQSFKGLAKHETFHWRGDKKNLSEFNGAFQNLLGGVQLSTEEMERFTKFVMSLAYAPSPFYDRLNRFKSPIALEGGGIFAAFCNGCHTVNHDGSLRLPGAVDDFAFNFQGEPLFLQVQEVAQLRGIYKKFASDRYGGFGLLHDGSETSEQNGHPLATFLLEFFPPGVDGNGNPTGIALADHQKVIDFVASFQSNVMGVVGWQVRVAGPATDQQAEDVGWMVVQSRLAPSQNDVVAAGLFQGEPAGFVLLPALVGTEVPRWRRDNGDLVNHDHLMEGDATNELVFMAVPPGSGQRIGVDWDLDCILNRQEHHALQNQDYNADGIVNADDLGDYITDYYTAPALAGPGAYAAPVCGAEGPPYDLDGFKVDITGDCIVNPDDLGDYITAFFTAC